MWIANAKLVFLMIHMRKKADQGHSMGLKKDMKLATP